MNKAKEQKKAFAIRDAYCAERLTGLMARHTSDARSINPNCIKPLLLLREFCRSPPHSETFLYPNDNVVVCGGHIKTISVLFFIPLHTSLESVMNQYRSLNISPLH